MLEKTVYIEFCLQCPCLFFKTFNVELLSSSSSSSSLSSSTFCSFDHCRCMFSWMVSWPKADVRFCNINGYWFLALQLLLQLGFCFFSPFLFLFSFLLYCSCFYLEASRSLCLLNNERIQIVPVLYFVIREQDLIE